MASEIERCSNSDFVICYAGKQPSSSLGLSIAGETAFSSAMERSEKEGGKLLLKKKGKRGGSYVARCGLAIFSSHGVSCLSTSLMKVHCNIHLDGYYSIVAHPSLLASYRLWATIVVGEIGRIISLRSYRIFFIAVIVGHDRSMMSEDIIISIMT